MTPQPSVSRSSFPAGGRVEKRPLEVTATLVLTIAIASTTGLLKPGGFLRMM